MVNSVTTSSSGFYLSGIFADFDTSALVEAAVAAKRIPADRMEVRVQENDLRKAVFQELSSYASALQAALNKLRNPPGTTGVLSNVFESKAAYLTSSSTTPGTSLLGVSASNKAATGSYEVEVVQLAKAHKLTGGAVMDAANNPVASSSTDLGVTDTLTIGLAGGDTANIEITADMSLDEIAAAINAEKATTGVRASVLKVSDNEFRLVLTAEHNNQEIEISSANGTGLAALGGMADTLQAAAPSIIMVDGIEVRRNSNSIADAIPEVTLDLYAAEAGTKITVEIETDLAGVSQALTEFVDAYNGLRDLIASQQALSGEKVDENAILFGDSTVRNLSMKLGSDLSALVDVVSGNLATLRSVGIELDANNRLTIDRATLEANLVDKVDQVRGVFEFGFSADSASLRMVGRTGAVNVGTFMLQITGTDASGAPTGAMVDGVEVFEISGNRLVGKAGTPYEGLSLAYVGPKNSAGETITVTTSLGIAERLYQTLEQFTRTDGEINQRIAALDEQNKKLLNEVVKIDERLETYRQYLISKYSAMEQAMAQAEMMMKQFKAMMKTNDD